MQRDPWRGKRGRGGVSVVAAVMGLLLLPPLLWGNDGAWLRLAEDSRMVYLMEMGPPVRSAAGTTTVRLKRAFREPYVERAYALDTMEIDCGSNLYRYTQIVIFDRDDDVMHRYRLTDQFAPVEPGSIPGRVKGLVCTAS